MEGGLADRRGRHGWAWLETNSSHKSNYEQTNDAATVHRLARLGHARGALFFGDRQRVLCIVVLEFLVLLGRVCILFGCVFVLLRRVGVAFSSLLRFTIGAL